MRVLRTMREALADPDLLGGAMPGDSWLPWRTLLIAAMGEELTDDERAVFAAFTGGREREPGERVKEFWGIAGRRSGKTRAAATMGAYVATCCDFTDVLAPGERGVLPVLASSRRQALRAFLHIKGVLEHSPLLSSYIDGEPSADTIRLRAPVDIEVAAANFKTVRGITAVGAICDELAFWDIEGSANPDKEILAALRPSLLTTRGVLWVISSPYAEEGELFKAYRRHFGPDGAPRALVVKGPSLAFNPLLDAQEIEEAYDDDAEVAEAEYGGEFRSGLADFISRETVEACVVAGVRERPAEAGIAYRGFCDPSGGSSDSMTLSIAHQEGERIVQDVLVEVKAPFSPDTVTAQFADILKAYGLREVEGDRYAMEWVRERFRANGITFYHCRLVRSDLYLNALPLLRSQRVDLLDAPRMVHQLSTLKRRVAGGGRESIDHKRGAHDDVANVTAGVMSMFALRPGNTGPIISTYGMTGSKAEVSRLCGTYAYG